MLFNAVALNLFEWALLLTWLLVGLSFYAGAFSEVAFEERGRVPAQLYGPADAGFAAALSAIFLIIILTGFQRTDTPSATLPGAGAMIMAVVVNTLIFLTVMFGVFVSLYVRRLDWRECFGVRTMDAASVLGRALLLIALALPLVGGALLVSHMLLGTGNSAGEEQEVVRFFVGSKSWGAKLAVAVSATILAPVQEEFVFRGYLYPVFKRYGGPVLGLIVNAALFAGIHLHVPSLAGLFTLAACLTLAYEWTGSLLVPMAMHALFNSLTVFNLLGGG